MADITVANRTHLSRLHHDHCDGSAGERHKLQLKGRATRMNMDNRAHVARPQMSAGKSRVRTTQSCSLIFI